MEPNVSPLIAVRKCLSRIECFVHLLQLIKLMWLALRSFFPLLLPLVVLLFEIGGAFALSQEKVS